MAGERVAEANSPAVTRRTKAERTERLLNARLEELARALESSGAPSDAIERLLEAASVATMNAVALDLISADLAESLWREVEERHPAVVPLRRAA